jgi:hypothetical protein
MSRAITSAGDREFEVGDEDVHVVFRLESVASLGDVDEDRVAAHHLSYALVVLSESLERLTVLVDRVRVGWHEFLRA